MPSAAAQTDSTGRIGALSPGGNQVSEPQMTPLSLDLRKASAMCGYSVKTLRRAIDTGKLPAVRATAKVVILLDDLRAYLEAHKIVPSVPAAKLVKGKSARSKMDSHGQQRTRNRKKKVP